MIVIKVFSTSFDNLKRRVVKFLRFGLSDTQTALEIGPYGTDSNPVKDMIALYASTPGTGDTFIVGYLNKNKLAGPGEYRIFSTDENGNLKTYIWLTGDGKIKLGGITDNAVRFKPLDKFSDDIKQFLTEQLALIASGIATGGGSYTPGTPTFNVDDAKIDDILTP